MNKIITSFEMFNESKHATTIADSKEEAKKDKSYIDDAKKLLSSAKKLDLKKCQDRSYLSELKDRIDVLSKAIKSGLKSSIVHSKEKLEKTIKNCNFK